MIEIRRAVPGDGETIARTRQKCWDATYRGIFPDEANDQFDYPWHIARDEQRLERPDFFYHLVLDGGECVGYLSYGVMSEGSFRDFRFRLQSLYLLPEYQGRGLGKHLLQMTFDACREMGYDKLCWDCSPHNRNAMDFYAHMGGEVIDMDIGHTNRQEDGCTFAYDLT